MAQTAGQQIHLFFKKNIAEKNYVMKIKFQRFLSIEAFTNSYYHKSRTVTFNPILQLVNMLGEGNIN